MVSATLLKYREFQNPNQKIMTHMGHSDCESLRLKTTKKNFVKIYTQFKQGKMYIMNY